MLAAAVEEPLAPCSYLPAGEAFEPITFGEFVEVIRRTKASAQGQNELPHEVWMQCGPFGAQLIFALYVFVVAGGAVPP